jgi:hypothetical protein
MDKELLHKYISEAFKEATEATGAASAGNGISAPAFSMWSEDEEAKSEYKRMEGEFTEATDSSSMGAYDANSFEDISMKGSTTKGKGRSWKKSQIPGGSFVEVKEKCKTFPYCNQGNTGAVKYKKSLKKENRNLSPMNEAILNVSLKTGLSVNKIKNIILSKIDDNL